MELWKALELDMERHRVVTLVGGGGKSSTMYALARQARDAGKRVIVTTSTHILPHPKIFLTDDPEPEHLKRCLDEHGVITLGTLGRADKLCGTGEIGVCKGLADVVLIEGDGARVKPLKVPAAHEPVIPPERWQGNTFSSPPSRLSPFSALCATSISFPTFSPSNSSPNMATSISLASP